MSDEVRQVEIVDAPEVKEEVTVITENLPPEEKALAEKHGLIKKDTPKEEVKDEKKEVTDQKPSFEEVEKDEKNLVKKYGANEQALYWKWKHDKKERQTAQAERDLTAIKARSLENKLNEINGGYEVTKTQVKKVRDLLAGPADEITVEALQAILAEPKKVDDENRPLTKKDLVSLQEEKSKATEEEQKKQEFINNRVKGADEVGKAKFDNYEQVADMVQEVLEGKVELPKYVKPANLAKTLVEMLADEKIEYDEIADWLMDTAKLNPKFGKKTEGKKETKENIERILDNASKQKSSASLGSGNGRRFVSEDDLTIDDAAKLTAESYRNLSQKTRDRLKREASA